MKWITTPISVSVHPEGESPVFSERATIVRIEDDAAGPFVVIKQNNPDREPGDLCFELDDLEITLNVAKELLAAHEALEK